MQPCMCRAGAMHNQAVVAFPTRKGPLQSILVDLPGIDSPSENWHESQSDLIPLRGRCFAAVGAVGWAVGVPGEAT